MNFEAFLTVLSFLIGAATMVLGTVFLVSEISYVKVSYPLDCLNCGTQDENNIPVFVLMILSGFLLLFQVGYNHYKKNKFGDQE